MISARAVQSRYFCQHWSYYSWKIEILWALSLPQRNGQGQETSHANTHLLLGACQTAGYVLIYSLASIWFNHNNFNRSTNDKCSSHQCRMTVTTSRRASPGRPTHTAYQPAATYGRNRLHLARGRTWMTAVTAAAFDMQLWQKALKPPPPPPSVSMTSDLASPYHNVQCGISWQAVIWTTQAAAVQRSR